MYWDIQKKYIFNKIILILCSQLQNTFDKIISLQIKILSLPLDVGAIERRGESCFFNVFMPTLESQKEVKKKVKSFDLK